MNIKERRLLFFHYNYHHYHYHHFHYHCKMHLYRLRILLTIPLDCNMIPCLFKLFKFCLLNFVIYFSLVIFQAFRCLHPVKGLRYRLFRNRRCCLLYLYLWLFTLPYLHLTAFIYLHLLIYTYVLSILLYELDKIAKIWGI